MRFTEALNFSGRRSARIEPPCLISLFSLIQKPLAALGSWRRALRVNGLSGGCGVFGPVGAFRSRQLAFVNAVLLAIHRGRWVPRHDCTGTEALVLSDRCKHPWVPSRCEMALRWQDTS